LIFSLYPRVKVKLGGEEHIFDRSRLMFTEVAEIEKATGLSFGEWQQELGRYSITAVAALLHILRKRAGMPSDFVTMQFNSADLDVIPLHEDDTEFTAQEVAADLAKRMQEAEAGKAVPTVAADGSAAPGSPKGTTITSLSSLSDSTSGRSNGSSSPGPTSRSARRTSTRS
jgi:hypothetical protein